MRRRVAARSQWRSRSRRLTARTQSSDAGLFRYRDHDVDLAARILDKLRRLCAEDPEAPDELEKAIQGKHGGDRNSQNIKCSNTTLDIDEPERGRGYALRRLRKDRPDLHAKKIASKSIWRDHGPAGRYFSAT